MPRTRKLHLNNNKKKGWFLGVVRTPFVLKITAWGREGNRSRKERCATNRTCGYNVSRLVICQLQYAKKREVLWSWVQMIHCTKNLIFSVSGNGFASKLTSSLTLLHPSRMLSWTAEPFTTMRPSAFKGGLKHCGPARTSARGSGFGTGQQQTRLKTGISRPWETPFDICFCLDLGQNVETSLGLWKGKSNTSLWRCHNMNCCTVELIYLRCCNNSRDNSFGCLLPPFSFMG